MTAITQTRFPFDNSYARLPEGFFAEIAPTHVAAPRLIKFNEKLAEELGLPTLEDSEKAAVFSGNALPGGAQPIAMAYSGHQFGHFSPELGDGRAILLGEVVDRNGRRRDIQLKGSGPTPFSRRGDGRAALGPVLREYLVSEAFHALGIPATRALAAVTTGERVYREVALPGAVLTRVASSHVRVGTFQYFAARRDREAIMRLVEYVIDRHYPDARSADRPARALFESVVARQAQLVARWMQVGFIHGVMNTDNMSISGETIDFGPCAFMDHYDPAMVFSSIDTGGRYAYANQPIVAQWNLARLVETLMFLFNPDADKALEMAKESLASFKDIYQNAWLEGFRRKLGLFNAEDGDLVLIQKFLDALHTSQADFTIGFRSLAHVLQSSSVETRLAAAAFAEWRERWTQRLSRQPQTQVDVVNLLRTSNPAFIPRNHRIEQIIEAAIDREDFSRFHEMTDVLSRPFDEQTDHEFYARPPQHEERVLQTFCGT
jgi:uncharacterized protein YdiU (UPF0061 family)